MSKFEENIITSLRESVTEGQRVSYTVETEGFKLVDRILKEKLAELKETKISTDEPNVILAATRFEDGINFIYDTISSFQSIAEDSKKELQNYQEGK